VPRARAAVVVVLLVLALPACGGEQSGPKTYDGDGYSFAYPGNWEERPANADSGSVDVMIAAGPGRNGISLTVFEVEEAVTEENFAELEPTIREAAERFMSSSGERVLEGGVARTTVGGLPGVTFQGSTDQGGGVSTSETWVFDGTTAYAFNCQSTSGGADEVARACDQVLSSFELD
jgi:hypothetical protein